MCNNVGNGVTNLLVTVLVTPPPTRPDPLLTYVSSKSHVNLHLDLSQSSPKRQVTNAREIERLDLVK